MSLSPLRAPEHHHGGGRLCCIRASLTQDMRAQDEGRQARGARRVPAHMTSITEMSLGPPQGSLGVIREEGSEEAGSDADEGESAPQAESSKASAAREAPSKGRKRWRSWPDIVMCPPCGCLLQMLWRDHASRGNPKPQIEDVQSLCLYWRRRCNLQ